MNNAEIQKCVGLRVKELREKRKMLQKTVAEALCVSVSSYAKLESGDRGISSENCIALADLFGVSCDYILRGVDYHNVDVWKKTGLENKSIAMLIAHKDFELDALFGSGHFWEMVRQIYDCVDYWVDPVDTEKNWDLNGYIAHKRLDKLLQELRNNAVEYIDPELRRDVETMRDICENGNGYEYETQAAMIQRKWR